MTTIKYSWLFYCQELLTCPKQKKTSSPLPGFPRDEQGVAILSAPLGSWRAVPGKAVACTVISCTGWYHRPSNCTNYYLSLESGKMIRSVGGTLQDGCTRDRKGNILTAEAWQQSCKCHTFASSCTIFGESSFNHPEKHPNRRNTPQQKKYTIHSDDHRDIFPQDPVLYSCPKASIALLTQKTTSEIEA